MDGYSPLEGDVLLKGSLLVIVSGREDARGRGSGLRSEAAGLSEAAHPLSQVVTDRYRWRHRWAASRSALVTLAR
jgi:hypothetical protein